MEKNLIKILEGLLVSAGLSEKEARVYLILLQLPEAPASKVMTKSGLKKGNTYAILHQLETKGLVTTFKKGRKAYFRAEPPAKVLQLLDQKSIEVNQAKVSFAKILPKLSSQYKMTTGKPVIRYFEGEEGVKEVFWDVYNTSDKEQWGCVDIEIAEKALKNYILPNLKPIRIKKKYWSMSFSALSPTGIELKKKDLKEYRKQILIDRKKYPLPAEIDVYEDKIAMMSFAKGEFISIIIENKDFAESLRSVFKYSFERLYSPEIESPRKKKT
jgi:sugar-specific transcriptional regulator TrmB